MKKIEPRGYQDQAVRSIYQQLVAMDFNPNPPPNLTATISHSAPTGAGKTVTMIHLVEQLILGKIDGKARPDLRVLWVSGMPEINLQTREKFEKFSDVISTGDTYIIDESFDEEYLRAGSVGFINTQKLSKKGKLIQRNDGRHYTFWDTLNNTLRDYHKFKDTIVIIDEAHHGANATPRQHQTILSRFLDTEVEGALLSRPPKIIGISATPGRFEILCENIGRAAHSIPTKVSDVRASGALKEVHRVHQGESFTALLPNAANDLIRYSQDWETYHNENQDSSLIIPLLCIQVRDKGPNHPLSETDLAGIVATLQGIDIGFELEGAIFHCFGNKETHEIGGIHVPHIEPSKISGREDIRVVLFKTAIIAGWDCPRAEILISDRVSEEYQAVCQLIGRMVRAPLQQKIIGNEALNAIDLYLPNFNEEAVDNTIKYLEDEMGLEGGGIIRNPITYTRHPEMEDAFHALTELPSYNIQRFSGRRPSQFRLLKLCALLEADGIVNGGRQTQIMDIAGVIRDQRQAWIDDGGEAYAVGGVFSYTPMMFDVLEGSRIMDADEEILELEPTDSSFDSLHSENRKIIPEEVINSLEELLGCTFEQVAVDLSRLLSQEEFITAIKQHCNDRIDTLRVEHITAIRELSNTAQNQYRPIIHEQGNPEEVQFNPPTELIVSQSDEAQSGHLYTNDGTFFCKLNNLEIVCLDRIRGEEGFIGWYLNPKSGENSLSIPYRTEDSNNPYTHGTQTAKHPDFLAVRKVGDGYIVDIYEPHAAINEAKPWFRIAQGFAYFAEEHGESFGRIQMSVTRNGEYLTFDFNDEQERQIAYQSQSNEEFWNTARE